MSLQALWALKIAALLILLEPKCTKKIKVRHGFKIGLGKAYGLGSVVSSIKKIWLRKSNDSEQRAYEWIALKNHGELKMLLSGNGECKELKELIQKIQNRYDRINALEGAEERKLEYPNPMKIKRGSNYWKEFRENRP